MTRKLYVPNSGFGDTPGSVSVVDLRHCTVRDTSGCARTWPTLPTGRTPMAVAIDPTTHTVYTADGNHSTVTVIDDGRVKPPRRWGSSRSISPSIRRPTRST